MLGKHTDYAGGRSMVCATERGFRVAATPRADSQVTITDTSRGERVGLEIDPQLPPGPDGHWSLYPRVVARRVARNFPRARRGADIAFESDLPPAAGLSSSSAFMIGVFLAIAAVNNLREQDEYASAVRTPEDRATYLACVENGSSFGALAGDGGVGTVGGSEDHTAILCSQEGHLSVYSFAPARLERRIPVPAGYVFAVASSGVAAQKTGAALAHYNRAAAEMSGLLGKWNAATGRDDPTLARAIQHAPRALDQLRAMLRQSADDIRLLRRLDQFAEESTVLVPQAANALNGGDLERFGALVDRSQALAETALGNQVPETIALAHSARTIGAAAASAFGAGYGGSVWALVPDGDADEFTRQWKAHYLHEFPQHAAAAAFFITAAGHAATEVLHG